MQRNLLSLVALASALSACHAPGPWSKRFIDPVSAGTTFESPVIESNVEAHLVHQEFPDESIFGGGGFNLGAVQARFAVDDRLAIIATKDGVIDLNPDVGADETGLADLAGGVKYMAYADEASGVIVTPGLILELPTGDEEVFQGNGDGVLRPFVSAGLDRGELNILGNVGYNHPFDDDEESASVDYHLHVSYEVAPNVFPLLEVNGVTYTSDGATLAADFEGYDLINLGASDVSGQSVVTGAIGGAYTIGEDMQIGLTYEWPWTSREDLLDHRIWVAFLWRF